MKRQTVSHSPHFAPERSERRVDLDWVRIGAFGLLIFYHVGMLYVSWGSTSRARIASGRWSR
jgi:hypothetical protein